LEFSQFDRHPAYARVDDRRGGADRRGGLRRQADRAARMRDMAAFVIAFCGGLAALYLFFVVIGTIKIGDALVATGVAAALALIWLFGFWRRVMTGTMSAQRPDRERRGF
jgi:hypothetical protein